MLKDSVSNSGQNVRKKRLELLDEDGCPESIPKGFAFVFAILAFSIAILVILMLVSL